MAVKRVGIRELRQNLSHYVGLVKEGEEFVVTERGVEVARLTGPNGTQETWLARMRREGKVKEGKGGMIQPVLGHLPPETKRAIMEDLIRERDDRL